jgi:hypothetical protein
LHGERRRFDARPRSPPCRAQGKGRGGYGTPPAPLTGAQTPSCTALVTVSEDRMLYPEEQVIGSQPKTLSQVASGLRREINNRCVERVRSTRPRLLACTYARQVGLG